MFSTISGGLAVLLIIAVVWSLAWKGLALWRAARRTDTVWFVVLLFVNTLGILDIIYYYLIAKTDKKWSFKKVPDQTGTFLIALIS